ncbi:uncharacterized protein JN550_006846 [Neoarthrinium moseri]|uniref:uncharacterized protein n=1 Tax=Neoarthrinium moseri TaxID=1658444 RepID=UPI001FDB7EE6|nr:uncharacterized protein JN550_006846 [Neoarthrinium moseri]KAI1867705.1 hypothetical protein JN550_006846 [Neoarthrinium moseri]
MATGTQITKVVSLFFGPIRKDVEEKMNGRPMSWAEVKDMDSDNDKYHKEKGPDGERGDLLPEIYANDVKSWLSKDDRGSLLLVSSHQSLCVALKDHKIAFTPVMPEEAGLPAWRTMSEKNPQYTKYEDRIPNWYTEKKKWCEQKGVAISYVPMARCNSLGLIEHLNSLK